MKIGRLCLRAEGDNWNAYYAMPENLKDAILLGSIKLRFVESDKRRAAFMELMKEAVADLIEEIAGDRPMWNEPRQAPESERGGTA